MNINDMQKKFEEFTKRLTKKRTILLLTMIEENKVYEQKLKKAREEMERNFMLGLEDEVELNKEEIQIYIQSFSKNLKEMNILMQLLYNNHQTFQHN